jgi:hypothetical protein
MKYSLPSLAACLALGLVFARPQAPLAQGTAQAGAQPSFENDQVIINAPHPGVDVPGATRKMHDHRLNRVMIYLHPGGELLHYLDGHTTDLRWKEGEVQWSPASGYHYSEIPPELDPRVWKVPAFTGPMIVDVGIKKAGAAGKAISSVLDPLRVDPKDFILEFENSQVRILRLKIGPGQKAPAHEHVLNHLIVAITDQHVRETSSDGKAEVTQHKPGEFSWSGPSKSQLENLNDTPLEAVIVEFK